jgi:uncharacterized tellurite resistance protein B-like protein
MNTYPKDSPQAIARVLAMTMITDARLDDRELEIMDRLGLYDRLGLTNAEFAEVVRDYCDEVVAAGSPDGKVNLMDRPRIDAAADLVQDPRRRMEVAQMMLNIVKADCALHDAELALFRYILGRWNLSFDEVRRAVGAA